MLLALRKRKWRGAHLQFMDVQIKGVQGGLARSQTRGGRVEGGVGGGGVAGMTVVSGYERSGGGRLSRVHGVDGVLTKAVAHGFKVPPDVAIVAAVAVGAALRVGAGGRQPAVVAPARRRGAVSPPRAISIAGGVLIPRSGAARVAWSGATRAAELAARMVATA